MRKWLTNEQAEALGLTLNIIPKGRKKAKYRISQEQWDKIESNDLSVTSKTKVNDYKSQPFVLSAFSKEGKMLSMDEYCKLYSIPRGDVRSYKLITHTGTPYYNIVFNEKIEKNDGVDLDFIRAKINEETKRTYTYKTTPSIKQKEGVLKWADLHFGAHIRNLILTKDYDSNILRDGLFKSVQELNQQGFKKAHVHINGDLIESFSGLNHINSWMSMDKDQIGSKAVMLCTDLIAEAVSKIDNLGCIKIVAGNHDRLSKNNDEDVKGGAAELIAWGLSLKGFNVEFHPYITTHLVDGINHINLHGDKGISKRSTKDIIWDYGIKGKYNFVFEAHLHSLIEKLSVSQRQKFNVVRDDAVDHRRMHLQSFFTGNYYSETLNFNSNAGYSIVWDNGKGLPMILNACV